MSQIDLLYRLQQIDDELRRAKSRLTEVIRAQRGNEALEAARRRAATAATLYQEHHSQQTTLNLELKGVNDKARRSEDRLYSGNVKNPKELEDLQKEIASLARRRALLEDELLDTMIALEEAEAEKEAADELLATTETEWARTTAGLQQEQGELARHANELAERRQQAVRLVTPGVLADYEAIRQRRGGSAVVELRNNICQGCQVTVSAMIVKAAGEGQLVHCGNCSRLLRPL